MTQLDSSHTYNYLYFVFVSDWKVSICILHWLDDRVDVTWSNGLISYSFFTLSIETFVHFCLKICSFFAQRPPKHQECKEENLIDFTSIEPSMAKEKKSIKIESVTNGRPQQWYSNENVIFIMFLFFTIRRVLRQWKSEAFKTLTDLHYFFDSHH